VPVAAQVLNLGERGRRRWPADLAGARLAAVERREHHGLQRVNVVGVADQHARAVDLAAVLGQHRPAPGAAEGGDVEGVPAEAVRHGDAGAGQSGWDGVAVAAEGDQRLRGHDPLDGDGGGKRRWQRRERLGLGECPDGAALALALANAVVADAGAERVQRHLRLGDAELVGQGAPPALRRAVVALLDAALAVAVPRGADVDVHAVVLGDRGERGRHPPGGGMADGRHPVEPPPLG
jgi:hypothetical protein